MTFISRLVSEKRRWRAYKARTRRLPEPYRTAEGGVEHYLMNTGPGDGDGYLRMYEDLADLFEQAAASGMGIRQLIGDPVEFADEFKRSYGPDWWMTRQQRRLAEAVALAEWKG